MDPDPNKFCDQEGEFVREEYKGWDPDLEIGWDPDPDGDLGGRSARAGIRTKAGIRIRTKSVTQIQRENSAGRSYSGIRICIWIWIRLTKSWTQMHDTHRPESSPQTGLNPIPHHHLHKVLPILRCLAHS